jgi:hypothetical protein
MKKIIALLTILISTLSAAQTYEIGTICKESTQGWMRLSGSCDKDGYLQGSGVAALGDLAVFGDFNRGLPNGPHYIVFQDKRIFEKGSVEYFINGRLGSIAFLNGTKTHNSQGFAIGIPTDMCKINFSNGQPADNILSCSGIVAKAISGNVNMVFKNKEVEFSMSNAEISGQHPNAKAYHLDLPFNKRPMVLVGSAGSVSLKISKIIDFKQKPGFLVTNLKGSASFPAQFDKYSPGNINENIRSVSGEFNYADGEVQLRYVKKTGKPATPIAEDFKYDFLAYGHKFRAAFYDTDNAQYLKIENGVEFDGAGFELCLADSWVSHKDGQPNVAGAVELSTVCTRPESASTPMCAFMPKW